MTLSMHWHECKKIVPSWILTILHSGFVSRTTQCINPCFCAPILSFAQHLACLSKHDPTVLLRRIHDNLDVARCSWSAGRCVRIHHPFWVTLLLGPISKLVGLRAIDISFGFRAPFISDLSNFHLCPCARGRPQLIDCCDAAASRFGWSVSEGIILSCVLFNSSWYSHPTLHISRLLWRYFYFNRPKFLQIEKLQFLSPPPSSRDR